MAARHRAPKRARRSSRPVAQQDAVKRKRAVAEISGLVTKINDIVSSLPGRAATPPVATPGLTLADAVIVHEPAAWMRPGSGGEESGVQVSAFFNLMRAGGPEQFARRLAGLRDLLTSTESLDEDEVLFVRAALTTMINDIYPGDDPEPWKGYRVVSDSGRRSVGKAGA